MEQFSLEKYLENPERKVVTRGGWKVRILCTDRKGTALPIIALVEVTEGEEEKIISYNSDGRDAYLNEKWDIFFADEAVLDKMKTDTTKKNDIEECCSEKYREHYNLSESKKNKIVSGKFLYALTNFSLFKKWKTYWLEYVGNDTYIGRSDNILNKKVVITPYQLDNYFSETAPSDFEKHLTEWFYGMRTWGLTAYEETCENFCDSQAHKAAKYLAYYALMRDDKYKSPYEDHEWQEGYNVWERGFDNGAEYMLKKAIKWLNENAQNYYEDSSMHDNCWYDDEQMIEDFQKAMEEK